MNIEDEKYYTTAEVAALLRQHPETIRRKIRGGKFRIPHSKFTGRDILIDPQDLTDYLRSIGFSLEGL